MRQEADQIIDLYRRYALTWAKQRGSRLIERVWLNRFSAHLRPDAHVLDLGCGSGLPIGCHFVELGYAVTGIDASPELIEIAQQNVPAGDWLIADMRDIALDRKFDGILAWDSFFHLPPDDQRAMFEVFRAHASDEAVLMFTSGPEAGQVIGEFEGEPLYHASLAPDEYLLLLEDHGFKVMEHIIEDVQCNGRTVWFCKYHALST